MTYETIQDTPYECRSYIVGHDGLVNRTDLLEQVSEYNILKPDAHWSNNQWESGNNICKHYYLNDECQKFRITTTVTIMLDKQDKNDTIINHSIKGINSTVYYYKPNGTVVISIAAGSRSCFDNSGKLDYYKKHKVLSVTEIMDIVAKENERILNNVNVNSNHNLSSEQLTQALKNFRDNNS